MVSDDEHSQQHIFYPAGGAFNKLRLKQSFLENVLSSNLQAHNRSPNKRSFVERNILSHFPDGLKVWRGKTPEDGYLETLDHDAAIEKILQVMRDRKKRLAGKPGYARSAAPKRAERVAVNRGACVRLVWTSKTVATGTLESASVLCGFRVICFGQKGSNIPSLCA